MHNIKMGRLCKTLKQGETLKIGEATIYIVRAHGSNVRMTIEAPEHIRITDVPRNGSVIAGQDARPGHEAKSTDGMRSTAEGFQSLPCANENTENYD
jgi:hypothetical protein